MATKYTVWPKNRQNSHTKCQHLPLQDLPKFTQIWIFCLHKNIPSGNSASLARKKAKHDSDAFWRENGDEPTTSRKKY
jgi:hypothetical protein